MAAKVRAFLEANNLGQYFENFEKEGFDDMDHIVFTCATGWSSAAK